MNRHPRPDFEREYFILLDGQWDFDFDDQNKGLKEKWFINHSYTQKINVPYVYQCPKSGIDDQTYHPVLWYSRIIKQSQINELFKKNDNNKLNNNTTNKRIIITFGAVDYKADLFINSFHLYSHEGGYLPFSVDITDYLAMDTDNKLTLRVEDINDPSQLRGKQYWKQKPDRCWYTPSSGIWQSVYLEQRPEIFIEDIKLTPDIDTNSVKAKITLNQQSSQTRQQVNQTLSITITKDNIIVAKVEVLCLSNETEMTIPIISSDSIDEVDYWSPENPVLYKVKAKITSGDSVTTYFGMRKIQSYNGQILLNNKPYYQKLILNQGYFPNSLLTGSYEEYEEDLKLIKAMGFNGIRMHQKIEAPSFYHLADKLGLIVWGELPSGYDFTQEEQKQIYSQMYAFIQRDYNHPSIICWVPLNESWGVKKIVANLKTQTFSNSVYQMIKAQDSTRLISTNDGWEQVISDICAIHDYAKDGDQLKDRLQNFEQKIATQERAIYAQGYKYNQQPVLLTEFGGVALEKDIFQGSWGYAGGESSVQSYLDRIKGLIDAIKENKQIVGFCYTQFTDVFQEVNGLVTIDRKPKCNINQIEKMINCS